MDNSHILDYSKINHRVLSKEEESTAFVRYHNGDQEAFDLLVVSQIPLAMKIAGSFSKGNPSIRDEYIQEAQLTLVYSVTKFDTTKGYRLSTYMGRAIIIHLINYRKENSLIRIPRNAHSGKQKDKYTLTRCSSDYKSIPEPSYQLQDTDKDKIGLNLTGLSEIQEQVIIDTYVLDLKPREIAKRLGVPKRTIHRAKTRALEKLRKIYLTPEISVL